MPKEKTLTSLQESDHAQKLFFKCFFTLTLALILANLSFYILKDKVPTLTQIELFPNYTWVMPFEIPAWWTILTGPYVAGLVSILWYIYHDSYPAVVPVWKITACSIALGILVYFGYGIATAWIIAIIVGLTIDFTVQIYIIDYYDRRAGRGNAIWVAITLATTASVGYQGFFGLLLTELLIVTLATIYLIYCGLCEVPWYRIEEGYYDARRYLKWRFKTD